MIDAEADLRQVAETGADLILVSSDFDTVVDRVASDYPDTSFVAIDPSWIKKEQPNVTEVHFAVEDSAFLAGVAAAMRSTSGVVGFIGGNPTFSVEQSRTGFEQGATFRNPDIKVLSRYLGPVENPGVKATRSPDLARELAAQLFAEGADVIFYDAGESGRGVVAAAREYEVGHPWVIGSNVDAYVTAASGLDREYILTSTVKRFDSAVEQAVASFLDGTLQSGEQVLGFAEQAVGWSREGGHLDDVAGELDNLAGDIALGHLTVQDFALRSPGWQMDPDVTVRVAVGERSCTPEVVEGGEIEDGKLRLAPGRRDRLRVHEPSRPARWRGNVHGASRNDSRGSGRRGAGRLPPGLLWRSPGSVRDRAGRCDNPDGVNAESALYRQLPFLDPVRG